MPDKTTPGDWTAEIRSPRYMNGVHSVAIGSDRGRGHVATAFGDTLEEAQANARLIAGGRISRELIFAALKWGASPGWQSKAHEFLAGLETE